MKWIRVASRISADSNVRQLARDVGADVHKVVGHLVALWGAMTDEARDGDLSKVHDDDLEAWAEWTGRGHKRGMFARSFRAVLCDERGVVRAWEKYQGAALREHEADRKRKTPKHLPEPKPQDPGENSGGIPAESSRTSGGIPPLRDETSTRREHKAPSSSRDLPTEQRGESGATSAPEPRSLALVRPESPTVLPALVDEPALPATRTRVARAKTPPRSGGEITAALSAWIDDTRAGAVHRQRADDERRNLAGVVFVYWQSVWQKPDAMLDEKREKLIVDRLRENGNNLDELLHAIDGGKRNTFAKGRGGALRLLLGDRGAVEEFAGEVGTRRLDAHPRADALRRALAPAVATPTEVVLHA